MSRHSVARMIRAFIVLAWVMLSVGCSTHMVGLTYDTPEIGVSRSEQAAPLRVEPFRDERGTDEDWLGAIRGGYGNPLKKLRTEAPTAELVTQAFRDALVARGMLVPGQAGSLIVTGALKKLDCSYYVNREAHAHIFVEVLEADSGSRVFGKLFQADQKEGGVGAGIFGSVEGLHRLAERTAREAIDMAVDDPDFRRALNGR